MKLLKFVEAPEVPEVLEVPEASKKLIESFLSDVLTIRADENLTKDEKIQKVLELCRGAFDIKRIAVSVLGRYYKKMNAEEKATYLTLFEHYVLGKYKKIFLSDKEVVEFKERRKLSQGKTVVVAYYSLLLKGSSAHSDVDFQVSKKSIKIRDVKFEGISLLLQIRKELKSFFHGVNTKGFLEKLSIEGTKLNEQ